MKREHGFTVAELAVTVLIFAIVSFVIFDFLDRTTSSTNRAISNVNAEQTAQIALRTMTQDIRSANPIGSECTAPYPSNYASCLRFTVPRPTAANPNCESSITYGLISGVVKGIRTDTNCATAVSTARDLITVVNPATTPLFTYYDSKGKQMPLPPASGAVPPAAAKSVKIALVVKYTGQTSDPLVLSSVAALRNNR